MYHIMQSMLSACNNSYQLYFISRDKLIIYLGTQITMWQLFLTSSFVSPIIYIEEYYKHQNIKNLYFFSNYTKVGPWRALNLVKGSMVLSVTVGSSTSSSTSIAYAGTSFWEGFWIFCLKHLSIEFISLDLMRQKYDSILIEWVEEDTRIWKDRKSIKNCHDIDSISGN